MTASTPAQLPVGAPLAAQYLAALAPTLPDDVRALPVTSARYRLALRGAALAAGWPLHPSRRELGRAAAYLARIGDAS